LYLKQLLAEHLLYEEMKYRGFLRAQGRPSQAMEASKKNRWRVLKRHRLEDGIPKEEEEKPRKHIIRQTMVQRNRLFSAGSLDYGVFPSVFLMLAIT